MKGHVGSGYSASSTSSLGGPPFILSSQVTQNLLTSIILNYLIKLSYQNIYLSVNLIFETSKDILISQSCLNIYAGLGVRKHSICAPQVSRVSEQKEHGQGDKDASQKLWGGQHRLLAPSP